MAVNGEVFGQLGFNLEDLSLREWMYETLYGNLEESFSSRVFHRVVGFSTKWSYTKTNHNATTETRKKRAPYFFVPFFLLSFKYILLIFQRFFAYNVQHTFWKISLPPSHDQHCQPWSKWQCDRRFNLLDSVSLSSHLSSDRCDFDFLGNTHESITYGLSGGGQKLAVVGSCHGRDLTVAYQLRWAWK